MSENREQDTRAERARLKWGKGVCVVGIFLAVLGVVAVFFGTGASVVPGALGIMLGVLGYFLGANRLGTVTIILSTATLFFGLAASQGQIPGIDRSDRTLPAETPQSEDN